MITTDFMKKTLQYLSVSLIFLFVTGCAQQVPTRQQAAQSGNTAPATAGGENAANPPQQNQRIISILNYVFDPAIVTIKTGTTVRWVNNDPVSHKIVSVANPPVFSSDNISQGGSYSFTFTTAGTFGYFCQIHPMMKGSIVVTP